MGNDEEKAEGIRSKIGVCYYFLPTPGRTSMSLCQSSGVPQEISPSPASYPHSMLPPFGVPPPFLPHFFIPGLFLTTQPFH